MRAKYGAVLCIIFFFCFANESDASTPVNWLNFKSASAFFLQYPDNWFRIQATGKNLNIVSSPQRVEAVIIPRDGQMIAVYEIKIVVDDDYKSFFQAEDPNSRILGYQIINNGQYHKNFCPKISDVESSTEVGPKTRYLEHHMYCRIGTRLFVLDLTQWAADKINFAAYKIAIHMIETLHT